MQVEPSAADVSMVMEALGDTPNPQGAPASPAVAEPVAPVETPQTSNDPFESLVAQPTEVAQPLIPAEPATPVIPTAPVTPMTPVEPVAPVLEAPVAQAAEEYQTFEEYMDTILAGVEAPPASPDPSKVNPDSQEETKTFFDDLMNTAVARVRSENQRSEAIKNAEKRQWDTAFDRYPTLQSNKELRDMVHNIRMGYFQRGKAVSPIQAADKLLEAFGKQYKQGVADNHVVTTIEQVQPTGGNAGEPVATTLGQDSMLADIQTGGEAALAAYLDVEVKNGRL